MQSMTNRNNFKRLSYQRWFSLMKPGDKVTPLTKSQGEKNGGCCPHLPKRQASVQSLQGHREGLRLVLSVFIPWTGHNQKLKWLLLVHWWCSADNNFTSSFISIWAPQQFTSLHSHSTHPPLRHQSIHKGAAPTDTAIRSHQKGPSLTKITY